MTENEYNTPPQKKRDSNLELYRIIVMLFIIAHHYVVNSGLTGLLFEKPLSNASMVMLVFGAWGKTGINCFVLITGWFMCRSRFTWGKVLKLYLQVAFYSVVIYGIFCITGHENFKTFLVAFKLFPIRSIADGFTSCFLIFLLLIPFLNILIQNITKRQHLYLISILLFIYTVLPTFRWYILSFNYVSWFCVLYLIASFIRNNENQVRIKHSTWGWLSISSVIVASLSILTFFWLIKTDRYYGFSPYFLVTDSNKILSLVVAICTFMWFKDLKIKYSPIINTLGAATFGVLLIHANSPAMRQWLWEETIDCIGHFGDSVLWTLGYSMISVLIIFFMCAGIDTLRAKYIEPFLLTISHNIFSKIADKIPSFLKDI